MVNPYHVATLGGHCIKEDVIMYAVLSKNKRTVGVLQSSCAAKTVFSLKHSPHLVRHPRIFHCGIGPLCHAWQDPKIFTVEPR